jgi:hypothetical protein
MSAISSSASYAQSPLLQQAQQLRTGQNDRDQDGAGGFKASFEAAAKAIGVDPAKIPGLEQQIQQAIQGAQSSAAAGSTTGSESSVRTAIDDVLKQNGIDPQKLHAQLQKSGKSHKHHGKRPEAAQPSPAAPAPAAPVSTASVTGAGALIDAAA